MAKSQMHSSLQLYLQEINATPLLTHEEEQDLAQRIASGDCLESRDRMIRANLRLVVAIAKRYARSGLPLGDLIEEGNLGLMRAVESYDPSHGAKFSTYAAWWIKQSIRRAMSGEIQPMRIPSYMQELIGRSKKTGRELEERLGRPATLQELAEAMEVPASKLRAVHSAVRASQRSVLANGDDLDSVIRPADLLTDDRTPPPDHDLSLRDDLAALRRLLPLLNEREAAILRLRYGLDGRPPITFKEIGQQIGLTRERVRQLEMQALRKLQALLSGRRRGRLRISA